jgi:protein tyrosine phosphatase (PTP) superfamily phosphohydrolase (DUF442 family)
MSPITDFLQLTPALATAGQPSLAELAELQQAGYEVVINLATPASPNAVPDEAAQVQRMGMEYIAVPVVWENPTAQNLADFFTAMNQAQQKKVFVHCARNMRVSAFMYLYRVLVLKWSDEQAAPDLLKIWQPNETWTRFIAEMVHLTIS